MAPRQELADWFKSNQSLGYTRQQLIEFLLIQGYDKNEVYEAAEIALGPEKAPPPAQPQVQKPPEPQPQPVAPKPAEPSPGAPPSQPEQPKSQFKIPYTLIGVIAVLAVLAVGAYYLASMLNLFNSPAGEGTEITANTSDETPPPTNYTPPSPPPMPQPCTDSACFAGNFTQCTNASSVFTQVGRSAYYEIIGPSGGLCEVKVEYLSAPEPQFVGKEMVCGFDNSMGFETASQNLSACSGELYDLILASATVPSNCLLKTPVSSLEFKSGANFGLSVSGFQGKSTEVSWKSLDESVVTASPSSGSLAIIKMLKPGLTKILITDNSIGPACTIAINVTVKQ